VKAGGLDDSRKEPRSLSAPDFSSSGSTGSGDGSPSLAQEHSGGDGVPVKSNLGPGSSSSPSSLSSEESPSRRCGRPKHDGRPCMAWAVRGQEACAGHLGLGVARAPRAYGRVGGAASHEARRRQAAGFERLEPSRGSELDRAFCEAVEYRLANPRPDDDPLILARMRAALDRRRKSNLQATARQEVGQRPPAEPRSREEEERRFIEKMGGGDFERGLEIVEHHHREAEKRRLQKEAETQRQREIADAEEKLRDRDRRLARAIRREESTADM
jgi:hypothetical protein